MRSLWKDIRRFFSRRSTGRTLVLLVCLKLFVMFAIIRVFFFQPAMRGMDDREKAEAVSKTLNARP